MAEDVRSVAELTEDPIALTAKASKVLADCETFLEVAAKSVRALPAEREAAFERRASAEEQCELAEKEHRRVRNEKLSRWHEVIAAEKKYDRVLMELNRANKFLDSDNLDPEYRKAIARQIAALLQEDSLKELDEIAVCSDDLELQRTVEECKEGVNRATRYVIKMFPGRDFPLDEVRKARTEAREILDRLKNPPVD